MNHKLSDLLKEVREYGKNPRVHPNGFIQLDLDEATPEGWEESKQRGTSGGSKRLHIWNPPGIVLPHQHSVNEIHDHVFDMESRVIRGSLIQRLFSMVNASNPTHEIYRAVYDDRESRLQPTGEQGVLINTRSFVVSAGNSYTQPAFTLHDTFVTPGTTTVTVMHKTRIHDGDATVVCPIDKPPDNDFNRATAADPDELMAAIERSLSR